MEFPESIIYATWWIWIVLCMLSKNKNTIFLLWFFQILKTINEIHEWKCRKYYILFMAFLCLTTCSQSNRFKNTPNIYINVWVFIIVSMDLDVGEDLSNSIIINTFTTGYSEKPQFHLCLNMHFFFLVSNLRIIITNCP